jgi:hypothetical protein
MDATWDYLGAMVKGAQRLKALGIDPSALKKIDVRDKELLGALMSGGSEESLRQLGDYISGRDPKSPKNLIDERKRMEEEWEKLPGSGLQKAGASASRFAAALEQNPLTEGVMGLVAKLLDRMTEKSLEEQAYHNDPFARRKPTAKMYGPLGEELFPDEPMPEDFGLRKFIEPFKNASPGVGEQAFKALGLPGASYMEPRDPFTRDVVGRMTEMPGGVPAPHVTVSPGFTVNNEVKTDTTGLITTIKTMISGAAEALGKTFGGGVGGGGMPGPASLVQ